MRLLTHTELERRSEQELRAIFRSVSTALVQSERGLPARRNALASLENISRALNARYARRGL